MANQIIGIFAKVVMVGKARANDPFALASILPLYYPTPPPPFLPHYRKVGGTGAEGELDGAMSGGRTGVSSAM